MNDYISVLVLWDSQKDSQHSVFSFGCPFKTAPHKRLPQKIDQPMSFFGVPDLQVASATLPLARFPLFASVRFTMPELCVGPRHRDESNTGRLLGLPLGF